MLLKRVDLVLSPPMPSRADPHPYHQEPTNVRGQRHVASAPLTGVRHAQLARVCARTEPAASAGRGRHPAACQPAESCPASRTASGVNHTAPSVGPAQKKKRCIICRRRLLWAVTFTFSYSEIPIRTDTTPALDALTHTKPHTECT